MSSTHVLETVLLVQHMTVFSALFWSKFAEQAVIWYPLSCTHGNLASSVGMETEMIWSAVFAWELIGKIVFLISVMTLITLLCHIMFWGVRSKVAGLFFSGSACIWHGSLSVPCFTAPGHDSSVYSLAGAEEGGCLQFMLAAFSEEYNWSLLN